MAYCGPRGIALDAFLSWSKRSQDAALEWSAFESRRCKHCGTHPDEWADDPFAFHAHLTQCKGCQEQQRVAESPDARQGRGITAVCAHGPASACQSPGCQPLDD